MRGTPHPRDYGVLLEMLKAGRRRARMRQADVAAQLGRAQATVSKVERGEMWLDVIELRAWVNALEIDFIEFMRELDTAIGVHRSRSHLVLPRPSGRRGF